MEYKSLESTIRELNNKPIVEEKDYEGEMARGELMSLANRAKEIAGMIKPDSQLEAWVQSKITKAEDYINSVYDYLKNTPGSIKRGEEENE
jgi:hypothetical protein